MKKLLLALVGAFAPLASSTHAAVQDSAAPAVLMLRLRTGDIQWGAISAHDPEGIVFQRLDTNGVARLAWSFLHPEEERELRERYGYVDLAGEGLMLEADRILTVEGTELIGRIVSQTDDVMFVKTASATIPVPKNRLAAAPTKLQVPASEIFTREELYNSELLNTDLTKPEGHYALAQFCERALDFAHAVEHYTKAQALDASFRENDVRQALVRALEKAARQSEIDYLSAIDTEIARRRFDVAIAEAEAFAAKFPDSPLTSEAKKRKDKAIKARDRYIQERVAQLWFDRAGKLARDASNKMNFEQVLAYLDGQIGREITEAVSNDILKLTKEATPDAVKKMWIARKKSGWKKASYGMGTWLLGKDRALKGEQPPPDEKPITNAKDKERDDLEQKLTRFLQNQELARKSKSDAEQVDDREVLWKELPAFTRESWVLAYYGEFSGDFEVSPKPTFTGCPQCGGKGTITFSLAGTNVSKTAIGKQQTDEHRECTTCHGLGVFRKISFR